MPHWIRLSGANNPRVRCTSQARILLEEVMGYEPTQGALKAVRVKFFGESQSINAKDKKRTFRYPLGVEARTKKGSQ